MRAETRPEYCTTYECVEDPTDSAILTVPSPLCSGEDFLGTVVMEENTQDVDLTSVRTLVKSVSKLAKHLQVSNSAIYRWIEVNRDSRVVTTSCMGQSSTTWNCATCFR